jgi:hypothetical protein
MLDWRTLLAAALLAVAIAIAMWVDSRERDKEWPL